MANVNVKPTNVVTGEVRISYEHLLKPYANKPSEEAKYSATLLIPKSDLATKAKIDAAIQMAIQEGVSGKWNGVKPPQVQVPIHDGDGPREDGTAYGEECRGHYVMTASSKQLQEIVDANRNPILNATEIYSGMYAVVFINFFAYLSNGKKGIGCGLGPVMKTRDGEPLGGRVTAADAFGGQTYNPAVQPPAGYSQPPQQPQYGAPAPQYQAPQYTPQPPIVAPAQPFGAYPAPAPVAPQAAPNAAPPWAQQQGGYIDPITGQPLANVAGGVMGLGQ